MKEGKLEIKLAGRGREQSRRVSFKERFVCKERDRAVDGEAYELKGKEGEPETSSFGIKLPTGT